MTVLEKLTLAIEQGHPNETEELVRKALEEGVDPVVLVEDVMVPVMREVGEKYKKQHDDITKLYEKVTFQLNDTHPTVAVPELMRILMDVEGLGWDEAWEITTKTCAYTNHTIMAEALEKWPVDLFSRLLPRIYQIVEEINRRFLIQVREQYPGDEEKVRQMAVI